MDRDALPKRGHKTLGSDDMIATTSLKDAAKASPRYSIANTYENPKAAAFRFRLRRFQHIKPMIDKVIAEKGHCRIADIGGTEYYWGIFSDYVSANPVQIDLINLAEVQVRGEKFRSLAGNATELGHIPDNAYDLVHSNSVIEHVGDWNRMTAMAGHVRRIAPRYYVQTPNFWFPYEPHFRAPFFHWLPEPTRCALLMRFNLGFGGKRPTVQSAMRGLQSANLLGKMQFQALFPDATLIPERTFGLTKSFMAVRDF